MALNFCIKNYSTQNKIEARIRCENHKEAVIFRGFHPSTSLIHGYTLTVQYALVIAGGHVVSWQRSNGENLASIIRDGGCDRDGDQLRRLGRVTDFELITNDKVILIDQGWGQAFYHFLIEGLTKFFLLPDFEEILNNETYQFIVPEGSRTWPWKYFVKASFVRDIFELMGVSKSRLIGSQDSRALLVKNLTILPPSYCSYSSPYATQKMQEFFWRKLSPNRPKFQAKLPSHCPSNKDKRWVLIIVRKLYRYIKNHAEMMKMLKNRFPCEIFREFTEDHTAREIADLFAGAKIVMGPHGAGLSNVIFTEPPNTEKTIWKRKAMIEFNVAHVVQLKAYSRLALIAGMRYYGLLFGNVQALSLFGFSVDVSLVTDTVDKALKFVNFGDTYGDNDDKVFTKLFGDWRGITDQNIPLNSSIKL